MYKLSFRFKVLLYFVIAAVIPFAIAGVSISHKLNQNLEANFENINLTYVQNEVGRVDAFFKYHENALALTASGISYVEKSPQSLNAYLKNQLKNNTDLTNLYFITSNNEIYGADEGAIKASVDYTLLPSYRNAKQNQRLEWQEPYTDVISMQQCIGAAVPVYEAQGKFLGVLVGNIAIDKVSDLLSDTKYIPEAEIFLINSSGDINYDSKKTPGASDNIKDNGFIASKIAKDILERKSGQAEFLYQNSNWIGIYTTVNTNGWKIISILDENKFIKKLNIVGPQLNAYIWSFRIFGIIIAAAVALLFSSSLTKPLIKLKEGAEAISSGNLDHQIEIKSRDEMQEIGDLFNQMSHNLKFTYNSLIGKTEELHNNNVQLQAMNLELKASYQQLEATMAQLNESEEKYRLLTGNISDMIFIVNNMHEIVYINSRVERILGYGELDLIGKMAKDYIKANTLNLPVQAFYENDYLEFQAELIKKNGSIIMIEGSTKRITEENQVVAIQIIARDITQRKLMEDKINSKYNELQMLNRVSKAITSTLDLNSVLHSIVYQIVDISRAVVCTIRLIDKENPDLLVLKAIQGYNPEKMDRLSIDWNKDIIGQCVERKQVIIADLEEDALPTEYMKRIFKEEKARVSTFMPLIAQGRLIGVLSIINRARPADELIELLGSLANNIAIAIDNAEAYDDLKKAYMRTVQGLVSVVEAKDEYTESHSIRVANYSAFIAAEMGFSQSFIEDIWVAGVLHDIGKININDEILNKKDKLTYEEYEIIKQHPVTAYKILHKIGLNENIVDAVLHHHERYDGTGYPDHLSGDNISGMAAIISVADAFDAITSKRSYKDAKSIREGIDEILACKGSQFDPLIVNIFEAAYLAKYDKLYAIYSNMEVEFF